MISWASSCETHCAARCHFLVIDISQVQGLLALFSVYLYQSWFLSPWFSFQNRSNVRSLTFAEWSQLLCIKTRVLMQVLVLTTSSLSCSHSWYIPSHVPKSNHENPPNTLEKMHFSCLCAITSTVSQPWQNFPFSTEWSSHLLDSLPNALFSKKAFLHFSSFILLFAYNIQLILYCFFPISYSLTCIFLA